MALRSETRDVLNKVEELTGTPVEIVEDPTIPQLATIAWARNGVPFHLLRINASLGEPDYLIVYECGFILRLYHLPPEERYLVRGLRTRACRRRALAETRRTNDHVAGNRPR